MHTEPNRNIVLSDDEHHFVALPGDRLVIDDRYDPKVDLRAALWITIEEEDGEDVLVVRGQLMADETDFVGPTFVDDLVDWEDRFDEEIKDQLARSKRDRTMTAGIHVDIGHLFSLDDGSLSFHAEYVRDAYLAQFVAKNFDLHAHLRPASDGMHVLRFVVVDDDKERAEFEFLFEPQGEMNARIISESDIDRYFGFLEEAA